MGKMKIFNWIAEALGKTVSIPLEKINSEHKGSTYPERVVPVEFLENFEQLSLTNPDLSQALRRSVSLTNTGHEVSVDLNRGDDKKALEIIEEFARALYHEGAGADSLVNALLRQATLFGALSLEIIPDDALRDIESVRLVPVKNVRFKYVDGKREIVQLVHGEERILNSNQYIYYPVEIDESSPYGIPEYITALEILSDIQPSSIQGIKKIIKKFGILGFINASKRPPYRRGDESENEYRSRLQRDLENFAEIFRKNFENGATVSYDDTKIEHHSVTENTRGAIDLFREIEQQAASGLNIDPALLGRNYSTTETYAGVVYHAFLAGAKVKQRLVKRALERIYYLKLILAGYDVKRVRVTFHPAPVLDPAAEAQRETATIDNVIKKMTAGIIDADTAARELGYEKATGKPQGQSLSDISILLPLIDEKKKSLSLAEFELGEKEDSAREQVATEDSALDELARTYQKEMNALGKELETALAKKPTIKEAMAIIDSMMQKKLPEDLYKAIKPHVLDAWNGQFEKIFSDTKKDIKGNDSIALEKWHEMHQKFDVGKVYRDNRSDIEKAVAEELSGRPSDPTAAVEAARAAAGRAVMVLSDDKLYDRYKIVISAAVMKARNFANAKAIQYAYGTDSSLEVVAILDQKTSHICRTMNGRRIPISVASEYVDAQMSAEPGTIAKSFSWNDTAKAFNPAVTRRKSTSEILANSPIKLPPYHARCRTTVVPAVAERIITRTGEELKGDIRVPKIPESEKRAKEKLDANQFIYESYYEKLTKEELAAKINSFKGLKFNKLTVYGNPETGRLGKYAKHGREFPDVSNEEEYMQKAEKMIKEFDEVYLYAFADQKHYPRAMFYSDRENAVVVVNTLELRMETMYKPDAENLKRYREQYMRIL